MCTLTASDKNKLGNTVVYIARHVPDLSKTKLLKLLYLIEEESVLLFKTPFLGLPFEVWQAGPVEKDVLIDLSQTPVLLDGYIKKVSKDGRTYIRPVADFCDDEFSDNDIRVMDHVLEHYGKMPATALVKEVHQPNRLWYKVAQREGLLEPFRLKLMNYSDAKIDFSEQLTPQGKEFYKEQMDFLSHSRNHKTPASYV